MNDQGIFSHAESPNAMYARIIRTRNWMPIRIPKRRGKTKIENLITAAGIVRSRGLEIGTLSQAKTHGKKHLTFELHQPITVNFEWTLTLKGKEKNATN